MKTLNFKSVLSEPTRTTSSSETSIDNVFTNTVSLVDQICTVDCPFSDHKFVFGSLNLNCPKSDSCIISSRCLDSKKLELIRSKLSLISFDFLDSILDVNDKWFCLKKCLTDMIDEIAPMKKVKMKANNLAWVDSELRNLFKWRDKLFSKALKEDKTRSGPLWMEFRDARNICKSKLRAKMVLFFQTQTLGNFDGPQKFWDFYK